ncbi:MAG: DUF5309 family protein [Bacteroidales bacterium]|nr:DUF5309 family protein [Bacteroidales bacterium]
MKNKFLAKIKWMKSNFRLILVMLFTMALLMVSCAMSDGETTLAMALVAGVAGGKHVVGGPLSTDVAREASGELLLNEIDSQIVKIRPMATPVDQLSRCAGAKRTGSMTVDYYNVDTKPTSASMKDAVPEPKADADPSTMTKVKIMTSNNDIFDVSDTILVQGVSGYEPNGTSFSLNDLVLYVERKEETDGGLWVTAVNGKKVGGTEGCIPAIPKNNILIRMGRAASELDVMSPQFEALPQKARNFCQIFKCQIEQSTLMKMSNKEVPWDMSDQEEAAIYDMRLGMEKSFLFGVKKKLWDSTKKENIMLTGGIWYQAGKVFNYDDGQFTQNEVIDLMRDAFTGNAGSKRKILIGGSGLIGRLNKLEYSKMVSAGENVVKWGIDFTELRSKFGTLYVLLSEVFDEVGMPDNGMVIDPEYLQKYTHIPFSTEALNLKASGVRNVDALVLTEASCLVLRYPKAHMRIVMQ